MTNVIGAKIEEKHNFITFDAPFVLMAKNESQSQTQQCRTLYQDFMDRYPDNFTSIEEKIIAYMNALAYVKINQKFMPWAEYVNFLKNKEALLEHAKHMAQQIDTILKSCPEGALAATEADRLKKMKKDYEDYGEIIKFVLNNEEIIKNVLAKAYDAATNTINLLAFIPEIIGFFGAGALLLINVLTRSETAF
jgi:tRNA U34 5-methylaminomethyl-2-thiouridine-forming methyltransferase MnmC